MAISGVVGVRLMMDRGQKNNDRSWINTVRLE